MQARSVLRWRIRFGFDDLQRLVSHAPPPARTRCTTSLRFNLGQPLLLDRSCLRFARVGFDKYQRFGLGGIAFAARAVLRADRFIVGDLIHGCQLRGGGAVHRRRNLWCGDLWRGWCNHRGNYRYNIGRSIDNDWC